MRRSACLIALVSVFSAACSDSTAPATPDAGGCTGTACDGGVDAAAPQPDVAVYDITPVDGQSADGALPPGDAPSSDTGSLDGAAGDASGGMDAPTDSTADALTDTTPVDTAPPPCPLYQAHCGGVCVSITTDATHCGACGTVCATGQVCVGGACTDHCPSTLTACAGACVDTQSDSANCGGCGTACGAGMGCVVGRCERGVFTDPTGASCAGGGPPVEFGGGRCAGTVAETAFRWAICSCTDLRMTTPLVTDGFDSTTGPYTPGGLGAGVGVNNDFSNSNTTDVGGTLWVGGTDTWNITAPQRVRQLVKVNAGFTANNMLTADQDTYVHGDAHANVPVTIGGTLHIPTGNTIDPMVTYHRVAREDVAITPPCDCTPSTFVPVAAAVAEARTRNDNALIGLDSEALVTPATNRRLDLPCGRYYLSSIGNPGAVTIVVHGRTALFVGGNVNVTAPFTVTLDANAELDLVLGGSFRASAPVYLGSVSYPALTRVYLASPDGFSTTGTMTLGGNLYTPTGPFTSTTPLEAWGSVFAGSFRSTNTVTIHYDRAVLRAGDTCRMPPPVPVPDAGVSDGGSTGDASSTRDSGTGTDAGTRTDTGVPVPGCTSCRDCANQACNAGTCGACHADSDCCAPLQCWMGRCVVIPG